MARELNFLSVSQLRQSGLLNSCAVQPLRFWSHVCWFIQMLSTLFLRSYGSIYIGTVPKPYNGREEVLTMTVLLEMTHIVSEIMWISGFLSDINISYSYICVDCVNICALQEIICSSVCHSSVQDGAQFRKSCGVSKGHREKGPSWSKPVI